MKKLISVLLAVMLVLSMSVVALAEDADGQDDPIEVSGPSSTAMTITFAKSYQTSAGTTPATTPDETLSFTVNAVNGNPDDTMITVANQKVNNGTITVNIPSYTKVGKYNYTITENDAGTQGVIYDTTTAIGIQVLVTYNANDSTKLDVDAVLSTPKMVNDKQEGKINEIVNTYDLGSLTVKKTVSGNLASPTQKFDIDVTFTSDKPVLSAISGAATINASDWTKPEGTTSWSVKRTVSLGNGESAVFSNIPVGVTYSVEEQTKHTDADANVSDGSKGYTVAYTGQTGTITASGATATVTNTKGETIKTGITTDSLPYVVLLGCVALFGAAMIVKRKAYND